MEEIAKLLAQSAISGSVSEWARPSVVRELIQPWYTPLPVNAVSTGIALGGLGNSYTLNPRGRTVALNFLAGAPVLNDPTGVELQDFYFSERNADDLGLSVGSPANVRLASVLHPLVRGNGQPWWGPDAPLNEVEGALREMLLSERLLGDNLARVERWGLPLPASPERLLRLPTSERNLVLLSHVYAAFLRVGRPQQSALLIEDGQWNGFGCHDSAAVRYSALFPMVGFSYGPTRGDCSIERLSFSPVAHATEQAALPLTVTRFSITHRAAHAKTVTLAWLGENLNGYHSAKLRPGQQDAAHALVRTPSGQRNERAEVAGMAACALLTGAATNGGARGTTAMSVATQATGGATATVSSRLQLLSADSGAAVRSGLDAGVFVDRHHRPIVAAKEGLSTALAVTAHIPPNATVDVTFYLVLDYPELVIGQRRTLKRTSQSAPPTRDAASPQSRACDILAYAVANERQLVRQVADYVHGLQAVLELKLARQSEGTRRRMLATLTSISSTLCESSVWTDEDELLVRECLDYPFYNSLDVYFYGSFGLAHLWPELDRNNIRAFVRATVAALPEQRPHWQYVHGPAGEGAAQYTGPRKQALAPPHDLGSPFDALPNAYTYHDTNEWCDLGPKLVLLVYRSYLQHRDDDLLRQAYDPLSQLMRRAIAKLEPGLALPLSRGVSNTYDNLSVDGVQIYNAQLWIAALEAYTAMRARLAARSDEVNVPELSATARRQLFAFLWDFESHRFNYNTGPIAGKHLRPEGRADLTERLRRAGASVSGGLEAALNGLLYAAPDDERLGQTFDALCGTDASRWPRAKAERIAGKKQALSRLDAGYWHDGFSEYANVESDALFADQLIGDFYLSKLHLPTICSAEQIVGVLRALFQVSFLDNSSIVGIANLVQRDGRRLSAFQAQDVWVGVTFTILELMREHGLHVEYERVFNQLCDVIYDVARIPFGIPEGFNCTYDAARPASDEEREVVAQLSKASIAPVTASELHSPLFTAGRYMRPGSVFSLLW